MGAYGYWCFGRLTLMAGIAISSVACQPVNDGASAARIYADCMMGEATGSAAAHVNSACVYVNTSGATSSVPSTTVTPTVTVPVSAAPTLP